MATINTTNLSNFVPEIVASEILMAFDVDTPLLNSVITDSDINSPAQKGDTINVTTASEFTANDKSVNTAFTFQNPTQGTKALQLNQHKEVTFLIEDLLATNGRDPKKAEQAFIKASVRALRESVETALSALYTDSSNTLISVTSLALADLVTGKGYLDNNRAPRDGRYAVLDTDAFNDLLTADNVKALNYGSSEAVRDGKMPRLAGFNVEESIFMTTAGSPAKTYSMLIHKDAIVLGARPLQSLVSNGMGVEFAISNGKLPIRVTKSYNATYGGTQITAELLFGVKTLRPEMIVKIAR